ncbi:MAG: hypothetical protein JEY97_10800 [Bacteroidales bacterium]|nr:hypothetical protein [Bacteroidales bacterium]
MSLNINIYKTYFNLGTKIYVINKFRNRILINELNSHLKQTGHRLSSTHISRISFYTIQSCITNSWFSKLRGFATSKEEIKKGLYLGAFTPIYDDLMDSSGLTHSELIGFIENGNEKSSVSFRLLQYLYNKLKKNTKDFRLFHHYFNIAGKAQTESLKQIKGKSLTNSELRKISFDKGGYFTLLYRSVLNNPLIENEEKAIYSLGNLLQLSNDIFDAYKDFHHKQQTLVNFSQNINNLNDEFLELTDSTIKQFCNLDYPSKNIKSALYEIIPVLARGIVCLDQFLKLQEKNNGLFEIEKFTRKELICDMEKIQNIKKCINYSIYYKSMISELNN